jgi:hypothetical protein
MSKAVKRMINEGIAKANISAIGAVAKCAEVVVIESSPRFGPLDLQIGWDVLAQSHPTLTLSSMTRPIAHYPRQVRMVQRSNTRRDLGRLLLQALR